jgi:hypothetical protein
MSNIEAILADRMNTHGEFEDQARVTQTIMDILSSEPGWNKLSYTQREAMHMIAHKLARAIAGNPDHPDHWDDIAGYARLVSQRLVPPALPKAPKRLPPVSQELRNNGVEGTAPSMPAVDTNQFDPSPLPAVDTNQFDPSPLPAGFTKIFENTLAESAEPPLSLADRLRGAPARISGRGRPAPALPTQTEVKVPVPLAGARPLVQDFRPRRIRESS